MMRGGERGSGFIPGGLCEVLDGLSDSTISKRSGNKRDRAVSV